MKRTPKPKTEPAQLAIPETEFFGPLDALHRGEDSVIGFIRKNGETKAGMENLFSLTRREVQAMLPTIAQYLLKDAYFTVNGYNAQAPYNARATGLPNVWRKEKNLRYLNAVYADLDIGRAGESGAKGLAVSQASQMLIDLLTGGTLPQLSMTAQSGRGLYALWILRDDDDAGAPVTFQSLAQWGEALALYKQVNRAIYRRLDCLAADKICDAARVLRVPGTAHYANGEKAFYKVTFDAQGKLVTYTLRELAAAFGVPVMAPSLPKAVRESAGVCPARAKGPKALGAARAQELVILEQWRGGFNQGERRFCLRTYAQFLKMADASPGAILEAVKAMASNCNPAYPSGPSDQPLVKIVGDVLGEGYFATHKRIELARWLRVTPDEARELDLEKLAPIDATGAKPLPRGGGREVEKAARRAALQTLIDSGGILSGRDFAAALSAQGIEASRATINRDLEAMGFKAHAARKKAGRKSSEQLELPESD